MRDLETDHVISGPMRRLETDHVISGPMRGLETDHVISGQIQSLEKMHGEWTDRHTDIATIRLTQPRRPSQ